MSTPIAPYYYEDEDATYHWEETCSFNQYPNFGWKKTYTRPHDREPCSECRGK